MRNRLLIPISYMAQALTVMGIAIFTLRLYSYDLRVPFNYSGDSVVILMYIKGLIQDGWPTTISQLSAPFVYLGAAFPMLTSVDWLLASYIGFQCLVGYLGRIPVRTFKSTFICEWCSVRLFAICSA